MSKQTAVDYLVKELSSILGPLETKPMQDLLMVDAINKAKQMEKEQLIAFGYTQISSSADFWKDAQEFLKSQLPTDFEDKLKEYVTTKGYNQNEFRLFKNMLEQAVGFHGTVVLLKHYC